MTFDWFTFVAQLFNFFLLILLLRRFLYRPVLKIMDERQERIKAQIEEAKKREEHAAQTLNHYQAEQGRWLSERETQLAQVQADVQTTKQALLKEVRTEVEGQRKQWQDALAKEKEDFLHSLEKRATREVFESMRSALRNLADVELQEQIIRVFIRRLSQLSDADQAAMRTALLHTRNQVQVTTSFGLTLEQKSELELALKAALRQPVSMQVKRNSELICGLEMSIYDQKAAWSIASYLEALQATTSRQLTKLVPEAKVQVERYDQAF
jgi:F-type H+-transporting ATPase subunit b